MKDGKDKGREHPIPLETIDRIDVLSEQKDGKICMSIITSGYLDDSERTKDRLIKKINNYLSMVNTEEFEEDFGHDVAKRVIIEIVLTESPSQEVMKLIKNIQGQLLSHKIALTSRQKL